MIYMAGLAAVGLAFFISLFGTAFCKRLAWRFGFLDVPGDHKAHGKATPLLGGVAIFAAFVLPTLAVLAVCRIWAANGAPAWLPKEFAIHLPGVAEKSMQGLGIILAAGLLHIVGIIDDRKNLGPWLKLVVQFVAAAWVVFACDVRVMTFAGPVISSIVTMLWLVAITNSFNFLDNMDGLAAGVGAICTAALLAAAWGMGQLFVSAWLCVLLGAQLGFLPHNFPPAKIFMGDAGSLVIGFLLAITSCLTTYVQTDQTHVIYGLLVPLFLMAVPIYDTCSVMWIRISEGRNPMVGDRRHFSHRLVKRGMSTRTAVLTIYLCTGSTAIAASVLPHASGVVPAILLLAQTLFTLTLIALLEATPKGEQD